MEASHPAPGLPQQAERGMVVGPILWAVGILAVLMWLIGQGSSDFGAAMTADRISENLIAQASLIRGKIVECWLVTQGRPTAGWPATPASGLVSDLTCPGDPAASQNLWMGARPAPLPSPPLGFGAWTYAYSASGTIAGCGPSGNSGGICITLQPTNAANRTNPAYVGGVNAAAGKFALTEAVIDAPTLRFTLWIRRN